MTDTFSPVERSAIMRAVKSGDTAPERRVRQTLHGLGLRFRLHRADLPGRPDIVLPSRRVAIFVHGCFWHGHTCPRGARIPATQTDYWLKKIGSNRQRDDEVCARLETMNWRVETIWECETRDRARLAALCTDRIIRRTAETA